MTLLREPVASSSPGRPGQRPRRLSRWVGLTLLALVAGAIGVSSLVHSIEADRTLEPLRAAQLASSSRQEPIAVISPRVAERWSTSSDDEPTEVEVRALVTPGNQLLEAPFVALRKHFLSDPSRAEVDRCYYLAVQRGGGRFDAGKASAIVQVCYLDPFKKPQSLGSVTTDL